MSIWGRQPSIIIAVIIALVQAVGIFLMNDASFQTPEIVLTVLTLLAGLWTKRKVVPVAKLEHVAPIALKAVEDYNRRSEGSLLRDVPSGYTGRRTPYDESDL